MRDGSSRVFRNPDSSIRSVRFSPDGRQIAAGDYNGRLMLRSGQLASWWAHTRQVSGIVFMPDGEGLISGSRDGTLKYWDISPSGFARISAGGQNDMELEARFTLVGHTVCLFVFQTYCFA